MILKDRIELCNLTIIITGAAGFIGANLIEHLLDTCNDSIIVGIDNLNDYYDVGLKSFRLERIGNKSRDSKNTWKFVRSDISDKTSLQKIFDEYRPSVVVNLAAQAGVRYSIDNPDVNVKQNLTSLGKHFLPCTVIKI